MDCPWGLPGVSATPTVGLWDMKLIQSCPAHPEAGIPTWRPFLCWIWLSYFICSCNNLRTDALMKLYLHRFQYTHTFNRFPGVVLTHLVPTLCCRMCNKTCDCQVLFSVSLTHESQATMDCA